MPPPVAKLELHSGTRKPADKVSQVTSTPVSFLGQRLSIDENTGKPVHHNPYTGSANGHYQGRQDLNWNHHHENSKRCPAEAKRPPTSFLVTHFNSPGSVLCTLGIRHHSNFALVLTLQAPESPLTGGAINSTARLLFRQGNSELTPLRTCVSRGGSTTPLGTGLTPPKPLIHKGVKTLTWQNLKYSLFYFVAAAHTPS